MDEKFILKTTYKNSYLIQEYLLSKNYTWNGSDSKIIDIDTIDRPNKKTYKNKSIVFFYVCFDNTFTCADKIYNWVKKVPLIDDKQIIREEKLKRILND